MWVSSKPPIQYFPFLSSQSHSNPLRIPPHESHPNRHFQFSIHCGLRELRHRIDTVKSTQKITEAMKLVAAAKVRRAQEAVINGRPFRGNPSRILLPSLWSPEIEVSAVDSTPEFSEKAETRIAELRGIGVDCSVISVGKKGNSYFRKRPSVSVDGFIETGSFPTAKDAQRIADDVFSLFVSEEVDKVELLYTKFVSLVRSDPVIHTLLPLSAKGEVCDVNGKCVDASEDEFFRLTTKEGKLIVERDTVRIKREEFSPNLQFEQDPVQILDAMMPLYLNCQILRALQESLASELAARMISMKSATENAVELKNNLSMAYNRERQAKITGEILEIVAGAEALQ
ncbi:ATPase, F1 complex, gamma subunit protein [Actinidia rufa]|uniref:F-ATPase gamma subunit n=1 Tax=Actinidia rufa TaxID=165716 RepID=A0A7J0GP01_9ERIC|nr:ATPase, F1 complex, gamma subunit protein [Actinidia rufa]